jgi:hypothetical protein
MLLDFISVRLIVSASKGKQNFQNAKKTLQKIKQTCRNANLLA